MNLTSIVVVIVIIETLIFTLVIIKGGSKDKEDLMSAERCNYIDCMFCIDKNQCSYSRGDKEDGR